MGQSADRSGYNHQQGLIWPRDDADPQRHPARVRYPYVPRGQLRPGSVALWGAPEQSPQPRPQFAKTTAREQRSPQVYRITLTLGGLTVAAVGAFVVAVPVANAILPLRPITTIAADLPTVRATAPRIAAQPPYPLTAPGAVPSPMLMSANDPAPSITGSPRALSAPSPLDLFDCHDCLGMDPRFAGVTITLRGGQAAQNQIADQIAVLGPAAVTRLPDGIGAATHQVRYFRDEDQPAAQALADRLNAVLVDVTWLAADAPPKIDILLATPPDVN